VTELGRGALLDRLRALTEPATAPMVMGWCTLGSAFAAETVGRSGADVVCLDVEHGLTGWDGALVSVLTLSAARIPLLVRVGSHEPGEMMKALDAGADGVIVPHVEQASEAAAAVDACRYPPRGRRSWGPTRTSLLSSADIDEVNDRVVMIPMLESAAAVGEAAAIAAVDGVAALLVGSNDLALDLTTPGRSRATARGSAELRDLLAAVAVAATNAGVPAAAPAGTADEAAFLLDAGFRLVVLPSDAALLRDAVGREAARLRGHPGDERCSFLPANRY
jgi:4-hydroxy-2-oxoheptanedioate aldolase